MGNQDRAMKTIITSSRRSNPPVDQLKKMSENNKSRKSKVTFKIDGVEASNEATSINSVKARMTFVPRSTKVILNQNLKKGKENQELESNRSRIQDEMRLATLRLEATQTSNRHQARDSLRNRLSQRHAQQDEEFTKFRATMVSARQKWRDDETTWSNTGGGSKVSFVGDKKDDDTIEANVNKDVNVDKESRKNRITFALPVVEEDSETDNNDETIKKDIDNSEIDLDVLLGISPVDTPL